MVVGNLPMADVGLSIDQGQRKANYVSGSKHTVSGLHELEGGRERERERGESLEMLLTKEQTFPLTLSTTTSPLPVMGSPESFKKAVAGTTPAKGKLQSQ